VPNPPVPDLLRLGLQDRLPEFATAPRRAGAAATVCGRVWVGAGAILGPSAVIRGDGQEALIGDDFYLGERSTVHVAQEESPARIGSGVTVGAECVLRACEVGDRCVIEDRVVVLEGARIGAGSVLANDALVPSGVQLAPGFFYRGNPARAVRALESGELLLLRSRVRNTPVTLAAAGPVRTGRAASGHAGFVALTAQVEGRLQMESGASIWFGARIDGGHHGVHIGEESTVQDNCTAYAMSSPLRIGAGVTIGHNVRLQDCRIGDRSLIGAAGFIAAGTLVQDDVLLAPGSATLPNQVLQAGWLWGGRPARALAPLSPEDRARIQATARAHRRCADGLRQAIADLTGCD